MSLSTRKSRVPSQHSGSRKEDGKTEKLPILLAGEEELAMRAGGASELEAEITSNGECGQSHAEDNGGGRYWRDSSYKFWNDDDPNGGLGFRFNEAAEDQPPLKPLGQLLSLRPTSSEISLDMDELQVRRAGSPPVPEVSFSQAEEIRNPEMDRAVVVKCTSNDAHQRRSSWLLSSKPRSRLMDPPEPHRRNSSQQKSGFLSGRTDEDEDDPFLDADLPEDYKTVNLGFATLAESLTLVVIISALISSLTIPALRFKTLWDLNLWKWEVLVLALICGRLVSGWAMTIVVFLIMRNFMLRKRVLYFVYGLRKAVQNCLWLGLVFLTWHFLFHKHIQRDTGSKPLQYVTKILVCFLIGAPIWLVKTLIIKVLASYFHVSTFFDRIHEALFNQYIVETLSGPPLVQMKHAEDEEARLAEDVQRLQKAGANISPELKASVFAKRGQIGKSGLMEKGPKVNKSHMLSGAIQDGGIPIDHFQRLSPKNVSAWNMKRLINIVRYGSLTTLDEQLLDATQEDENQMQIRSEVQAKAAAKKIFQNVAKPRSKCIRLEDLMRFMEKDEAEKTLSLFEGASETCKISKSSLKNWVVKAFRERRALSLTLNDTKTAIKRLHQMVNLIVAVVIGLIWLIILGLTTRKLILLFGSQLVVCAFIFGNTLKNIFEALIFLFIIHPFDVGDRCEIDGKEYVVEEMNILSTVFLRDDNLKVTYLNNILAMKAIHNFYRSPAMGDAIDFRIHIATPSDKIAQITQRITSYIESKKDHWSSPMIVARDVEELDMVKYSVWLSHTMNHQDMGVKFERRARLVEEMVKIFKDVDIEYRIKQNTFDVSLLPGLNSTRLPPTWPPTRT